MSIVYSGTELKLNISITPLGDLKMEDYDFQCEFYCRMPNNKVTVSKDKMIKKDSDNYIATVDTGQLNSKGDLKCKIIAKIPDNDYFDGFRTEVLILDTGIKIMNN